MNKYTEIGSRIRAVRGNCGLSQTEFAVKVLELDTPYNLASTISKVKAGDRLPSTSMLFGFENLPFNLHGENHPGVSVDFILFGQINDQVDRISRFPVHKNSVERNIFIAECTKVAALIPEDFLISDETLYSECAFRLRQIRKKAHLNQGEFGLEKSCVSRNECTVDFPDINFLIHFCRYFHVPADYILFGTYPSLPYPLQALLLDRTYQVQQEMLTKFIEIGEKVFQK